VVLIPFLVLSFPLAVVVAEWVFLVLLVALVEVVAVIVFLLLVVLVLRVKVLLEVIAKRLDLTVMVEVEVLEQLVAMPLAVAMGALV
jgi:hypothetical protein